MKTMKALIIFLLLAGSSGSATKACSGTTEFTCPPYRTSGGEETCAYDIDTLNVDVMMESAKPESIQFFSSRKEKFTIWIRPDKTCDQPAACASHPFTHDFNGADPEAVKFSTGRAVIHSGGTACQYQFSYKKKFESWSDPILIVVK